MSTLEEPVKAVIRRALRDAADSDCYAERDVAGVLAMLAHELTGGVDDLFRQVEEADRALADEWTRYGEPLPGTEA